MCIRDRRLDEANGSESNVNTVQLSSTLAEHQDNEAQASNDFDLASLKAELLEILALLRPSMQATS